MNALETGHHILNKKEHHIVAIPTNSLRLNASKLWYKLVAPVTNNRIASSCVEDPDPTFSTDT